MLSLDARASDLLESTMASVKHVLQFPFNMGGAEAFTNNTLHTDTCVLVGLTGEIEGQMIIDGGRQTFGGIGANMFGMALEGDMLQSFIGELANMLAGNLCTSISQKQRTMDITPPTILKGEMKLFPFQSGLSVPIAIPGVGDLSIILLLQAERAG